MSFRFTRKFGIEIFPNDMNQIGGHLESTVKPLKYGHQRDRTKCPLYRGVRIIEVGNV